MDRHLKEHAHSESSWQLGQYASSADLRSVDGHHSCYVDHYFEDTIDGRDS